MVGNIRSELAKSAPANPNTSSALKAGDRKPLTLKPHVISIYSNDEDVFFCG